MTNLAGPRPQLEETSNKFVPGQPDMWMFVLFESLLLTGYFTVYLVSRTQNEELYLRSQAAFLTVFFGLVFLVSKVLEWIKEIHLGNTFTSNEFFQHYFFLTSIHCIHVLIGFIVLGVVVYQLWSPVRRSQQLVETCATYWHTVDFLWVLIFALLYVVR